MQSGKEKQAFQDLAVKNKRLFRMLVPLAPNRVIALSGAINNERAVLVNDWQAVKF
jgi:hypothetical protein